VGSQNVGVVDEAHHLGFSADVVQGGVQAFQIDALDRHGFVQREAFGFIHRSAHAVPDLVQQPVF